MIKNIPALLARISEELRLFTDLAVVGMSGGADSTLVTLLCHYALGKDSVYTAHMPAVATDLVSFNKLSLETARHLQVHTQVVSIADSVSTFNRALEKSLERPLSKLNGGNSRARLRMAVLYALSGELSESSGKRVRVIGTGNLSEDFIGYDTKGGDSLCDLFPIGELFKSEVYQLLEYFRDQGVITESMINRTPSAGLWEGQTDEKELGYTYKEMEKSIRKIMSGQLGSTPEGCDLFVLNRHRQHKHKHEAIPALPLRQFCDE
ncbi:MAG: NAD(+) synthase [Oligoflexales bacterium]|nr:NAD(+) synthase [Oligoflexales bacterium]